MSDSGFGSDAVYAKVLPTTTNSSIPHHAAVESVEDSAKVPGRIAYPLVVGHPAEH